MQTPDFTVSGMISTRICRRVFQMKRLARAALRGSVGGAPRAQIEETRMSRRILASLGRLAVAAALVSVAWVPLGAQTAGKGSQNAAGKSAIPTEAKKHWTPTRTPWGDPDLQGVWDYKTITPLERPQNMAGRQYLTEEEVNQLETRAAKRLDEP